VGLARGRREGSGSPFRGPRPPNPSPSHPSLVGTPSATSPLPRPHQRLGPVTASDHLEGGTMSANGPARTSSTPPHPPTIVCILIIVRILLSPISKYFICTEIFISPVHNHLHSRSRTHFLDPLILQIASLPDRRGSPFLQAPQSFPQSGVHLATQFLLIRTPQAILLTKSEQEIGHCCVFTPRWVPLPPCRKPAGPTSQ